MTTPWTLTYAYLAYALAVALAVVHWIGEVVKKRLYDAVADCSIDGGWLEAAHWLAQYLRTFIVAGWLLTVAGLLFAFLSAGGPAETASQVGSHKGYLLRLAAIVFAALCLSYVGHGDLSRYHLHLVAALVCGWAVLETFAGWRLLARGAAVDGPGWWWVGLVVVALLIVRLVALIFFVSPDSPGQF
jgi:hypothetical protein